MQLYFDENLANTLVHQKLTRSLKKTFYAADHCLSVFSSLVAVAQLEDKLKGIYKFIYSSSKKISGILPYIYNDPSSPFGKS